MINVSEGEMQRRVNEAEGKAGEITAIADATADSIRRIAQAISSKGGEEAVRLRLSQAYLNQLQGLARKDTHVLLPADLTRLDELLGSLGLSDDAKRRHTSRH